ncbi:S8 family peptidase [Neobacillus dielmonensis]|uniref:S8 family peptidase n=1 Tax=Neobacillus dielmonensis TaxID=1347369 RepID=UPI0005AA9493|nr:S8 family peptidase [Neobacillus dielmonensis]
MKHKWIIGAAAAALILIAVFAIKPYRDSEDPIQTRSRTENKLTQVQNLQQNQHSIRKVDSIRANDNLKMKLNSTPTVKIIHHNHQDKSHYYDNEVIVHFKNAPSDEGLQKILTDIDGVVKEKHDFAIIFRSQSQSPEKLMDYFNGLESVEFTEPHYIYLPNEINDTYYSGYQWNLPAISTEDGWNFTRGSKDVKIAVVDTGVDLDHPDLAGKLLPGYNAVDDNDNPEDDNGHGTHVAGIIASNTNNGEGVAGITWNNPIIPIKVMNSDGSGGSFDVAEGIRWAVDHGANVINLSLGNYQSSSLLEDAISYALSKDVVVIAAAGNDNTNQPSYPAAYQGVLGVAAVDWNGKRAEFSNYGDYIDIAAPGVDIPSTYLQGEYASLSGTSMAAPHVTALAGLIRSINPKLKNTEVIDVMRNHTQKAQPGTEPYYGSGIINNMASLQAVSQKSQPKNQSNWFNQILNR